MALTSGITGTNATRTANMPIAQAAAPTNTMNAFESDPLYQLALAQGSAQFNTARSNALADIQDTETSNKTQLADINKSAQDSRNRLAGNYAARGMAGGAAGALTAAESELNARQLAAQTSLVDQIAALNRNFNRNFGAVGTDWRGTNVGQEYVASAAQEALKAKLAGMGVK
jgi:hypothetical protein